MYRMAWFEPNDPKSMSIEGDRIIFRIGCNPAAVKRAILAQENGLVQVMDAASDFGPRHRLRSYTYLPSKATLVISDPVTVVAEDWAARIAYGTALADFANSSLRQMVP